MKDNIVSKTGIHNVVHWMKTWLLLAGYWIVDCAALFWSTFIIGTLSSEQFGMVGVFCACGLVMFGGIFAMLHILSCRHFRSTVGWILYNGFGLCWDLLITCCLVMYRNQFPFEAWMIVLIWGLRTVFLFPGVRQYFQGRKNA